MPGLGWQQFCCLKIRDGTDCVRVIVEVIIGLIIYAVSMWKGKSFWNFEYVRFAILFNIPLIPHYFATYIVEQSDRIMIQKLIDFGAAALYQHCLYGGGNCENLYFRPDQYPDSLTVQAAGGEGLPGIKPADYNSYAGCFRDDSRAVG